MFEVEPPARIAQTSHKLVLYLQGYPASDVARTTCRALLHHCGGDAQRTFDLGRPHIDDALQHALRVRAFSNPRRAALCVVHKTRELAQTLEARLTFETLVAIGKTAVWVLYWDPASDPRFLVRAQQRGVLIGDITEGATWRHASGKEFLILCPLIETPARLAQEADAMAYRPAPLERTYAVSSRRQHQPAPVPGRHAFGGEHGS